MGQCEPTTGIASFAALVDQLMSTEPYTSARRVFWVVDNPPADGRLAEPRMIGSTPEAGRRP